MRSMASRRRRRSRSASRRPINLTTTAAGIKLIEVHVDPATKATVAFPTTASPVRRVLVQDVDYRVETAPNVDAAGTLLQIVPLIPLLANNDPPGASRPRDIGYLVLVTNALRAANGAPIDADRDYATIKTAATRQQLREHHRRAPQCALRPRARAFRRRRRRGRESGERSSSRRASPRNRSTPCCASSRRASPRARRRPRWCCRCRQPRRAPIAGPAGPNLAEPALRHHHAALLPEPAGRAAHRHGHRAAEHLVARGESAAVRRRPQRSEERAQPHALQPVPGRRPRSSPCRCCSVFRARRPNPPLAGRSSSISTASPKIAARSR